MPTHAWRWVHLLATITTCAAAVVDGALGSNTSLVLLLSLLEVAHQSFADDILQAQIIGWVIKGLIPGVNDAYEIVRKKIRIASSGRLSTFHLFLVRLTGAGNSG